MRQGSDDLDRVIPTDAGIRDGLPVFQFFFFAFNERLVAFDKIGLDHDAHDVVASVTDLLADVIIYPDGFVKVVDLDELVAALEARSISLDTLKSCLRKLDKLLGIIYSGNFPSLKAYLEA